MKPIKVKNRRIFSKKRRPYKEIIWLSVIVLAVVGLYLGSLHFEDKIKSPIPPQAAEKEKEVAEKPEKKEEPAKAETDKEVIVLEDGTEIEVVDGPPMEDPTAPNVYTVQDGDTLWDIAEYIYGDGAMWTVLWEVNADVLTDADARNTSMPGHWIHPGQDIVVPEI
jgi:nucleoid-associated protein YgaU